MPEHATIPLAIISGGSGFLGRAIAAALEESDWRIVSLGRRVTEADTSTHQCDITNEEQVESSIKEITKKYGNIAACIHAAAEPLQRTSVLSLSPESFDATMDAAVRGAFLFSKAALPHMKAGSAFIGITTQAMEQKTPLPPMGAYIPAKYALFGYLRALSAESKTHGVRVYAVAPGFLPGGLNRDIPPAVLKFLAAKNSAGKASSVEEVAHIVAKMCIDPEAYPAGSSVAPSGEVRPL